MARGTDAAGAIDALRPGLEAAAAALSVPLADAETETLLAYLALLQRWNSTYNLTSVRDPAQMLTQHLADCLAVIGPFRRHASSLARPLRVMDVGSGGGLPGVLLAALNPSWHVTSVDTVGKKAAFVRQVAGELRLRNLHAEHARIEQLPARASDVITSRAFGSLVDFTTLSRPHLGSEGVWAAMKGKMPRDELAALLAGVEVFHVEQLQVPGLDAERCLVWMRVPH